MAYYTPQPATPPPALGNRYDQKQPPMMPPTPGLQNQKPQIRPPVQGGPMPYTPPGISPQVAALMRTAQPGGGYDNIGVPLSTLHGQVPGAGPVQPVQPGQMFQNAQMANAQFQNAQSKPMQMPPPQQSLAQRQAATVSGIANRPGVSPQVAALMRAHPSQGQSNDLPPPPMNRMRALR
jgi:hypothetical protein